MTDTFRKEYQPLSEQQQTQMIVVKGIAESMETALNEICPSAERSERSRCMAIARTNLETAIMWAVKAITTTREEGS